MLAVDVEDVGAVEREGGDAEADLVRLCRENGLTICATHEPSQEILDQPEASIARLQRLGCKLTAYPYPGGIDLMAEHHLAGLLATEPFGAGRGHRVEEAVRVELEAIAWRDGLKRK